MLQEMDILLKLSPLESQISFPSFSATESQEEEVEFSDPPKLIENSKFPKDQNLDQTNDVQQLMCAEDLVLNID